MKKVEIYKRLVLIKKLMFLAYPEDQKDAIEGLTDIIKDLKIELQKRSSLHEVNG